MSCLIEYGSERRVRDKLREEGQLAISVVDLLNFCPPRYIIQILKFV